MVIPCNVSGESSSGDVFFVVGASGDTWTIPGKRDFLTRKSEVFAVLLRDAGTTIRLPDVDKRGFEYLLRYLEGMEPKFSSIQTARTTLDVTYKFENVGLAQSCVNYLDEHLDCNTVLTTFKNLSVLSNNSYTSEPCAPEYDTMPLTQSQTRIQELCACLMYNCLLIIDENAEKVLSKEEVELLDKKDLAIIISRDTLRVKKELIVYECVMRWFKCELMRLGNKPVTPSTRDAILGDLIYKIRFGLMQRNEFLKGPGAANIFTANEINEILLIIDNPTVLVTQGPRKNINSKRIEIQLEPKYLSTRTEPILDKNIKTKKNKQKTNNTLLNCLTVWTVLFD